MITTFNCREHGEQTIKEHIIADCVENGERYHFDTIWLVCGCTRELDTH